MQLCACFGLGQGPWRQAEVLVPHSAGLWELNLFEVSPMQRQQKGWAFIKGQYKATWAVLLRKGRESSIPLSSFLSYLLPSPWGMCLGLLQCIWTSWKMFPGFAAWHRVFWLLLWTALRRNLAMSHNDTRIPGRPVLLAKHISKMRGGLTILRCLTSYTALHNCVSLLKYSKQIIMTSKSCMTTSRLNSSLMSCTVISL